MLTYRSFLSLRHLLFFAPLCLSSPTPAPAGDYISIKSTATPAGVSCGQHSATNRNCWKNCWNISTDYDKVVPPVSKTRTYDLHITNVTSWVGGDGVQKHAMLINNQFPGPTIEADWGDYLHINVHNHLQDNGTSIHWHGIKLLGEADQDGANGVTECPIPPGHSKTYSFHVSQYGTSWYHSHYSAQYGNGIVGGVVINGPASANYDIDLGPYLITDYYHETADRLTRKTELVASGAPPPSDNVLFRGKNINPKGNGGSYDRLTLTPGKKHRLRLINTSVDNSFTISLVGHNFTVIANDFVPVTPEVRNTLFMGVGQRYDVIVDANQKVDNYWLNATLSGSGKCGSSINPHPAAILQYKGASSNGIPHTTGKPIEATCDDSKGLKPVLPRVAPKSQFNPKQLHVNLTQPSLDQGQVFRWIVNKTPVVVEWDHPTLEYVLQGNTSYPSPANVFKLKGRNEWAFWVIQNEFSLPHPIHLHGHDFLLLGAGTGTFDSSRTRELQFENPVRRDVAQMPGNGWIVIAFQTDNPGAWLLHCHIGWHVSQGLGIQFLERMEDAKKMLDLKKMEPNCDAWRKFQKKAFWLPQKTHKWDSGL